MMFKRWIKAAILAPAWLMPLGLGRALCKWWCKALEKRGSDRAVIKHLCDLEEQIDLTFNQRAISYDGGIHVKHRLTGYHDFFIERIQRGQKIADIGCGKGELAFDIAKRCEAEVTALDIDPAKIEFAAKQFKHPQLTLMLQDALVWQPDETFDTIVLSNVLEHIEDRTAFLQTAQANLKPQRWLIRVPRFDRDWRLPLKAEMGLFAYGDPTHFIEYTPELFAQEMAQAGLHIEHIESRWSEFWAQVHAR